MNVQIRIDPIREAKQAQNLVMMQRPLRLLTPKERSQRIIAGIRGAPLPARKRDLLAETVRKLRQRGNRELLKRVESGEISPWTARGLMYPDRLDLRKVRLHFRRLSAAERREFFDWLKAQGVLVSVRLNRRFRRFTDGRRKRRSK